MWYSRCSPIEGFLEIFKHKKLVTGFFGITTIILLATMACMAIRDCNWFAISSLASFALMLICALYNKGCRSNVLTISVLVLFVAGIVTMFIALVLV